MTSRRTFLICGGAAVLIAGSASWALTRTPKRALEPWKSAEAGFGDPLLDFLAYAILAPNPHNMQPWRIYRRNETGFDLYADAIRLLHHTDPPARQTTIGFGCFLELFRQAAAERGWRTDIIPFPEGNTDPLLDTDKPIASVTILQDDSVAPDPLFQQALLRRTNRAEFDMERPPPQTDLSAISNVAVIGDAGFANDAPLVETLQTLAVEAWRAEWENPRTREESVIVTRVGKKEVNENPWGLSLTGPLIEALGSFGLLTRDGMREPGTSAYEQTLSFYEKSCRSSPAFLWLTTPENTRSEQLEAGRSWVRMQLKATELGLGFHPLSQALQEFPEMATHYARAHELLAPQGGTVQMLARIGYAKTPPPAPRENLEAKLVEL